MTYVGQPTIPNVVFLWHFSHYFNIFFSFFQEINGREELKEVIKLDEIEKLQIATDITDAVYFLHSLSVVSLICPSRLNFLAPDPYFIKKLSTSPINPRFHKFISEKMLSKSEN